MTTPDPSREAFEKHYCPEASAGERSRIFRIWPDGRYFNGYTQARHEGWQAAMAHKGAEVGGPNQAYRMLVPNVDIIRPDDEYLSDDTTTWEPVGRSIFVGMPHVRAFKPGRRKIEGST